MDILFTVLLGLGTVFVGLIMIVLLITLMHKIMGRHAESGPASPVVSAPKAAPVASAVPTPPPAPIPNRAELVAAVSAVIAEELGTDVSAIRICSIKKI